MDNRPTLRLPRKLVSTTIGLAMALGSAACAGCGDSEETTSVVCVVDEGQDAGPDFDAAVCNVTAPDEFHCPPGCFGEPLA